MLFQRWLEVFAGRSRRTKKIIYLITGVGQGPDDSQSNTNSTKYTGFLIKHFLGIAAPDIKVEVIHSYNNVFRYDENIVFVKQQLLRGYIEPIRDDLAHRFGDKWSSLLRLTISFADGSSARINTINAALSAYRPSYLFFWRLKTFWHSGIITEEDVETHSYEDITITPAVQVSDASRQVQLVVQEMKDFKEEFDRVRDMPSTEHDLTAFWLRKTKKPVLAVLLVQKAGEKPRLYRGTNMEVSMPTGSLCAERNVIGSALAADITLKRQDLRCVAVLSASLDPPPVLPPPASPLNSASSSPAATAVGRQNASFPPPLKLPVDASGRTACINITVLLLTKSHSFSGAYTQASSSTGPSPIVRVQSSGSLLLESATGSSDVFCLPVSPSHKTVTIRDMSNDYTERNLSTIGVENPQDYHGRVVQVVPVDHK